MKKISDATEGPVSSVEGQPAYSHSLLVENLVSAGMSLIDHDPVSRSLAWRVSEILTYTILPKLVEEGCEGVDRLRQLMPVPEPDSIESGLERNSGAYHSIVSSLFRMERLISDQITHIIFTSLRIAITVEGVSRNSLAGSVLNGVEEALHVIRGDVLVGSPHMNHGQGMNLEYRLWAATEMLSRIQHTQQQFNWRLLSLLSAGSAEDVSECKKREAPASAVQEWVDSLPAPAGVTGQRREDMLTSIYGLLERMDVMGVGREPEAETATARAPKKPRAKLSRKVPRVAAKVVSRKKK